MSARRAVKRASYRTVSKALKQSLGDLKAAENEGYTRGRREAFSEAAEIAGGFAFCGAISAAIRERAKAGEGDQK